MEVVIDELLGQCQHNVWEAISEVEYLLKEKDLFSRVREKYLDRDRENIELSNTAPSMPQAFVT